MSRENSGAFPAGTCQGLQREAVHFRGQCQRGVADSQHSGSPSRVPCQFPGFGGGVGLHPKPKPCCLLCLGLLGLLPPPTSSLDGAFAGTPWSAPGRALLLILTFSGASGPAGLPAMEVGCGKVIQNPLHGNRLAWGLPLLHPCSLDSVHSVYASLFLAIFPLVGGAFGGRMASWAESLVPKEGIHLLSTVMLAPGALPPTLALARVQLKMVA